jgi:hypothetical protein
MLYWCYLLPEDGRVAVGPSPSSGPLDHQLSARLRNSSISGLPWPSARNSPGRSGRGTRGMENNIHGQSHEGLIQQSVEKKSDK